MDVLLNDIIDDERLEPRDVTAHELSTPPPLFHPSDVLPPLARLRHDRLSAFDDEEYTVVER